MNIYRESCLTRDRATFVSAGCSSELPCLIEPAYVYVVPLVPARSSILFSPWMHVNDCWQRMGTTQCVSAGLHVRLPVPKGVCAYVDILYRFHRVFVHVLARLSVVGKLPGHSYATLAFTDLNEFCWSGSPTEWSRRRGTSPVHRDAVRVSVPDAFGMHQQA